MTPAEALREAALAGRVEQFEVSWHALQRMRERHVTHRDIATALKTATAATHEQGARWRLDGGHDIDGQSLVLVVVLTGRCLVVTMF